MTKMNSFPDHQAQQRRGKHSDDRRNASTFCASIVTPDRMLPQVEEELQPPTEDPMLQDGVLSLPIESLLQLRKYSHGRHSTRCCRMEHSDSRKSICYNCGNTFTDERMPASIGWSTPTGIRMLPRLDGVLRRPTRCLMMSEATIIETNVLILSLFECYVALV